jgi:nucleotide-binding universal stress UspA family protein
MDKKTIIKQEAESLLKKMIETFEIEVTEEEGAYHVIIKTDADAPTVIGRHGDDAAARAWLGGVAQKVIGLAERPVLVSA